MWIILKVIPDEHPIIYIPSSFIEEDTVTSEICFGQKKASAHMEALHVEMHHDNQYGKPIMIRLSSTLQNLLSIPTNLTYQMKIIDKKIILGPVIGLLLGDHTHKYDPAHMQKYCDRFGVYEKIGGLICAFSTKSIDWDKEIIYGMYYDYQNTTWEYGSFPIPSVIYRRYFHSTSVDIAKLKKITNNKVFNSYRFTKHELYNYIKSHEMLSTYLPPTENTVNFKQLQHFIDQHHKMILKPTHLSRGRGICILEKKEGQYHIFDYRKKEVEETLLQDHNALKVFFENNPCFFEKYIVQKCLNLAKVNHSVFDIRVVMQKPNQETWQCTGIECRVAGGSSLLTNISRNGYALPLEQALSAAFPAQSDHTINTQKIVDFCQKFCVYLEETKEHFSEFGIDIAIDEDEKIWLIEANVFPSFKGFKKMDYPTYLSIRYTPLLYALSYTEFYDTEVE